MASLPHGSVASKSIRTPSPRFSPRPRFPRAGQGGLDPGYQPLESGFHPTAAPPNRGHLIGGNRPAVAVATCTDFRERCPARIVPPADHDPKPKRFAGCAFGSSELLAGFEPAVVCGFRIRQPKQGHQPPAISPQQPAGLSTDCGFYGLPYPAVFFGVGSAHPHRPAGR